ncbi:helix-turn-helix domain-containing protein [Microbacterium sp. SORGH_AS_0862]|uniref:helix-turn-helix domain-containing protein n=1 Tax=Microbacterium sp. SORGH_AS_0862 TaxID=3041789 RepID=UPI00278CE3AB|nr:helix-turn-helix transcriptional regulator [Microbacterium sp. SORGH_AS_0862]MDQ1206036.1 transcriptional regulator with XRE-family HTH domain [Microbacterium sp. SORGH_AS_0862]
MTSKSSFGAFVQEKRRAAGMTQRQLASELFVTESAVSKWERGLSYPDISVVSALARAVGVSEGELFNASENRESRIVESQARSYRRWRTAILWTTMVFLGAGLISSLIVNLSVQHIISWAWVVLAAVLILASVTVLPLLVVRHRGWITASSALASTVLLLVTVRALYGGSFLTVSVASLLFVAGLAALIPLARSESLPIRLQPHRLLLATGLGSIWLLGYLLVVVGKVGQITSYLPTIVPLVLIGLAPLWTAVVVWRYLPAARTIRTAVIPVVMAAYTWVAGPLVDAVLSGGGIVVRNADLALWTAPVRERNVSAIVAASFLVLAAVSVTLSFIRRGAMHRVEPSIPENVAR